MKEIKNFINKTETEYLIRMIDKYASKSMVVGTPKEKNKYSLSRTSYTANLIHNDPTVQTIHKRISKYFVSPMFITVSMLSLIKGSIPNNIIYNH